MWDMKTGQTLLEMTGLDRLFPLTTLFHSCMIEQDSKILSFHQIFPAMGNLFLQHPWMELLAYGMWSPGESFKESLDHLLVNLLRFSSP